MTDFKLPPRGGKVFFAGLGGIGMSALAQFFRSLGFAVAGSDRDISSPSQADLFAKLAKQGINHYVQDGSGVKEFQPDLIVYSSALEEDNPDFIAAGDTSRLHRSAAMAAAVKLSGLKAIAIAGSCGKTSVTAWIAATLRAMGKAPVMINGGYSPDLESDSHPGNFGDGSEFVIFEADESDGSLVNFDPEVSILLNMGDDHHSQDKLEKMFATFLSNGQKQVVKKELDYLLPENAQSLSILDEGADFLNSEIYHNDSGVCFTLNNQAEVQTSQWGEHSADNALAVIAALRSCEFSLEEILPALKAFCGVRRRFEFKGRVGQAALYDDYAHNPQKIAACIRAAKDIFGTSVHCLFQPHGYGPLGFMRDALKRELKGVLNNEDKFTLLPVFYAGGTSSFKPSSQEVAQDYQESGLPATALEKRDEIDLSDNKYGTILVLGARDPSLPAWSASLCGENL